MFLASLIEAVGEEASGNDDRQTALGWKRHFETIRSEFYQRLTPPASFAALLDEAPQKWHDEPWAKAQLDSALERIIHAVTKLRDMFKSDNEPEDVLVLYLDEGHELNNGISLSTVTAVMADLDTTALGLVPRARVPFVIVLTSTSSALQALAERPGLVTGHLQASARQKNTAYPNLVQPWSPLPWNVGLSGYVPPSPDGLLSPRLTREEEYIVCRGRPM